MRTPDRSEEQKAALSTVLFAGLTTALFLSWRIAVFSIRDLPLPQIIGRGLVEGATMFVLMHLWWGSWLRYRLEPPPRTRYVLRQLGWAALAIACGTALSLLGSALLTR